MSIMNIAGTTPVDDPEYRYKMPRLVAKIEGRGNGIKTVVVNAVDIATSLHRTPGEVTKFFGCELGAQSKYDEKADRAVVNGAFDAATMQNHLSKFIELFVLCPGCRLPETKYKFKGANISHKCLACGAIESVDMTHKLTTFLLKEHASAKRSKKGDDGKKKKKEKKESKHDDGSDESSAKKEKKEKKEKKDKESSKEHKKKKEKKKSPTHSETDDEEEIEWHTDLSAEAVAARAKEAEAIEAAARAAMESKPEDDAVVATLDNLEIDDESAISSAVESIAEFLKKSKNATSQEIVDEVIKQQTFAALPVNDRLAIFFGAAFTNQILSSNQVSKYSPVLEALLDSERSQFQLIALCEHFCAVKYPESMSSFPIVLKLLYDEDLLSEEVILSWTNSDNRALYAHFEVTKDQGKILTKSLAPFVEWLQNAEEESEDED